MGQPVTFTVWITALVAGSFLFSWIRKLYGKHIIQGLLLTMTRADLADFPDGTACQPSSYQPSSLIPEISDLLARYKIQLSDFGIKDKTLDDVGREADKIRYHKLAVHHFDAAQLCFGALTDSEQAIDVEAAVKNLLDHMQQTNRYSDLSDLPLKSLENLGTTQDELDAKLLGFHIRRARYLLGKVRTNRHDEDTGRDLHELYRHMVKAGDLSPSYRHFENFGTGKEELRRIVYDWHFRDLFPKGSYIKC